jgi:Ca2+-transporting ATPase
MTMAFATMGLTQIFHCINNKFLGTIFNKTIFSNSFMNFAVGVTLFIILFLVLTPAGFVFGLNILTVSQIFICLFLALSIIPFSELLKLVFYKF